jgi:hypothetical protein
VVLATKADRDLHTGDFSGEQRRRSVERFMRHEMKSEISAAPAQYARSRYNFMYAATLFTSFFSISLPNVVQGAFTEFVSLQALQSACY